jgi:pimeloyl-ACP methyl ester carboxylesterase
MPIATSRDGTELVYERVGEGPSVVLVDGAFCHRKMGPMADLAPRLADKFTVFFYDRRGRGESQDTLPFTVDKEIDDLEAMIATAGGHARVYGTSSGAALAIRAAGRGVPIDKLALYETPFVLDASRPPMPKDYVDRIDAAIEAKNGGEAVMIFMKEGVLVPAFGVLMMRLMFPIWRKLVASAPTLPRDLAILGDTREGKPLPAELTETMAKIAMPTLVMGGSKSPPWLHHAVQQVAKEIPNAELKMLAGQTHQVSDSIAREGAARRRRSGGRRAGERRAGENRAGRARRHRRKSPRRPATAARGAGGADRARRRAVRHRAGLRRVRSRRSRIDDRRRAGREGSGKHGERRQDNR